ncbi:UV-stimulated scaffold protein A isoform X2 [Cynoglossus semilaevis]|uniref:UV-stimulated scaffold protein A isoform X2 n=1 Tax=Cynoglossus semilaevis TaxID=244447 RepID=UPI000D62E5AC|nr:UV-stimulated scaffold protein A isoform X2 [Cynoglossus semilaevis]
MSVTMESSQRSRLSELVEELTTSGQPQLNQAKIKEVKKICRTSNDCVEHLYHLVMTQLNEEHSEVRLSAFQIATELFSRSHHFRMLLVENFQEFLELTVETDSDQPLPPPKEVAKKLRSQAIQTVQTWQSTYGAAYKKLALGYHFLKQVKKVDFQDAEARTVAERRREEERRRRLERLYKDKVEAATKDMDESFPEIQATLTQMESCMDLLFPQFELPNIQSVSSSPSNRQPVNKRPRHEEPPHHEEPPRHEEPPHCSTDVGQCYSKDKNRKESREERRTKDVRVKETSEGDKEEGDEGETERKQETDEREEKEEDEESDEEEGEEDCDEEDFFMRSSGLISYSYSLDLNLSPGLHVEETEDNEAVVSTVMDLHRLITTKYLPAVQGWVQVFTKAGAEQQLLRRALDVKRSLEAALQKEQELNIHSKTRIRRVMKSVNGESRVDDEDDEDDDDDNFDEVPEKEGYEPHIPEHLRAEYGLEPTPSTSTAPVPPLSSSSSSSSSSRQLQKLKDEEQDPTCAAATLRLLRQNLPLSTEPRAASQHQFWVPTEVEEEVENQQLLAESRSRVISFPGSFPPVSHHCGAPLPPGGVCQRQDRLKCPFHGPIIPRDKEGRPLRQEDRRREEQEERRKKEQQPDWRDEELMRDIEAATGENLGSDRVRRKGKGKKKKFPNLSDLKQSSDTSRSRLQRKVFNKSSMRRVAEVMKTADSRKHDKFSNQFNYALN